MMKSETNPVWTTSGGGTLAPSGTTCTYTANECGGFSVVCCQADTSIAATAEVQVRFGIAGGEYQAGTGRFALSWFRTPGRVYDVYRATTLTPPDWQLVASGLEADAWSESAPGSAAFYRAVEHAR